MDRAVILGTFEFIGFHFCKALLDEGYEVEGIHINGMKEDPFLLEKRLEIGRNANFQEKDFTTWSNSVEEIEKEILFLIDYYDLYMQNQKNEKKGLLDHVLVSYLKALKKSNSKLVLLLPIQWLDERSKEYDLFKNVIRMLQGEKISFQACYLPSIFGPWQSCEFIFQQYFVSQLKKNSTISLNEREWVDDALFIEDVVRSILIKANQHASDSFILESGISDHWQKCAEYLSIPFKDYENYHRKKRFDTTKINVRPVVSTINYSEGLKKQKRHLDLLLNGGF